MTSKGIFQDWKANKANTKGKIVVTLFRIAALSNLNTVTRIVLLPYNIFYKLFIEWILGIEIGKNLSIGEDFRLLHGQGLVINEKSKIGRSCTVRHNTTIGNNGKSTKCPTIKDNVDIGANVCIIGDITIGNNVKIGAGAVVVKNVPDDSIVVGNPARILSKK